VEEVHVTDEDEYFPPPPELRDLLRGLGAALAIGLAAPAPSETGVGAPVDPAVPTLAGDRHVSAADVLARLAG
jgi:4-hydroxy-3-methylbut-2-enyl diphosphate reductase